MGRHGIQPVMAAAGPDTEPRRHTGAVFASKDTSVAPAREKLKKAASTASIPVRPTATNVVLPFQPTHEERDAARAESHLHSSSSSKHATQTAITSRAVNKNGMFSTIVYVVLATMLAISTYGLDTMANKSIDLGIIENTWYRDVFDIPISTFLQGSTTMEEIKTNNLLPMNSTYGTQSLSDLQYDECGVRDWACADKVTPNTERVLFLLGTSFASIPGFEVPELASSPETAAVKYVSTLSGYNAPVVHYRVPGSDSTVVCSVRRTYYRVAQETSDKGDIDSVAICSKRVYDPNWICENEVAKDVTTYIIKIKLGKVTYLGKTLRGEMYRNPGNVAKLTGSAQGTGLLSTVIGIDEYNGGILQSSAPWDMAPSYMCQGTLDMDTYAGMRWQGQGIVSMTWTSSSLMVTNSLVLWFLTMSLAMVQFTYLPKSSVCVIPVNMAKTIAGPMILGFACYGNYNAQVLTTYLNTTKVTGFDATPYRLCGPVMFSSVIALMSGTAIQIFFNPFLVSPAYVLTIVSVVNWIVVFVLEAFVFPAAPVTPKRTCGLATSTNCLYFEATVRNYYLSPMIGACAVGLGIVVIKVIHRRRLGNDLPPNNSVLKLLGAKSVRDVATSGAGGCVSIGPDGIPLVDAGILLNKNLVRISSTTLVRYSIVKYVVLYRILPPVFQRRLSLAVGVTMVVKAKDNRVLDKIAFLELKDMNIGHSKPLPSYYS